ncbi:MAG TPA: IMP cyclohydrolase [Lentisphaeria bacterium]|nr:MAG: IMP cyclohydrolase [Lentisphaerae bacterium GWF2_49_21]HBC86234.1 IMP cyclohydrolase [Lentisphaeria bacterium]
MAESSINRNTYLSKNVGSFEDVMEIRGKRYRKVEDLRYGTNPHQPAAYYKPEGLPCTIGDMQILKTGKSGLSQTNLEDISYALNIVKYFDRPACAVMKHVNPSGAAVQRGEETICDVYKKARDCDGRAAFGSVIAFNVELDTQTAKEIMTTFVECVVAPSFDEYALSVFNDSEKYKLNKQIRIIKCGKLTDIPRYVGESSDAHNTVKVLADGSIVIAAPLLTHLKSVADLKPAAAESKNLGTVVSTVKPKPGQMEDLLAAWYINLSVRSNGVVIMKNGQTLAVGTGEQDRVGAVEQAVWKYNNKYQGNENIKDAVMASDGFFPFPDAVEVAAEAGVSAMISPPGSIKDAEVIQRANELGVALVHAPERCFSHH